MEIVVVMGEEDTAEDTGAGDTDTARSNTLLIKRLVIIFFFTSYFKAKTVRFGSSV